MAGCEQCGGEVGKQGKRFCSTTCWYAFTKDRRTVSCEVCSQLFERKVKSTRTCSVECGNRLKEAKKEMRCETCGETYIRPHGKTKRRFCSRSCAMVGRNRTGQKAHPEGETYKHSGGYIQVKHHGKWMMQHRLVMEGVLGRKLDPNERIHHKNGVRDDNRPENLELWGLDHKDPAGVRAIDRVRHLLGKLSPEERSSLREEL